MQDRTIVPETRYTRRVTFRKDKVGVYLLFWKEGTLEAGVTWQKDFGPDSHYKPGLSLFSWEDNSLGLGV